MVNILNPGSMAVLASVSVDATPRSVDFSKYLLVGLRNGSIIEFDI